MNRIYRLCWNAATSQWVAASELARNSRPAARITSAARGPRVASIATCIALALGAAGAAHAGQTGGQIVSGSGAINQNGAITTINQNSQHLSLNWQRFDIAPNETVNFVQPGRDAIAVNRILGNSASEIYGHLNANGQVWLINPNGVLFGQGSQVNVGGLVASTLDTSDSTLSSNTRSFSGDGKGSIVNRGSIRAANGGYVALLGNTVSNQGTISAQLGTVAMGGGSAVTLTFDGSQLLHLQVDRSTLDNLVENRQLVQADGGRVLMTAGAADSLLASTVNNTGVVRAQTVENHNGQIVLLGGMQAGHVNVEGSLDASAPNGGNGGSIETSAAFAHIGAASINASAPKGKAGTWLVDPYDLTIDGAAAGTISAALNGGTNVTETTTATGASGDGVKNASGVGDINVNSAITWNNAAATLTLDAYRGINVNAPISGTGGVVLKANGAAGTGGNITLASGATIGGGAGVTLTAANNFINNAGAAALSSVSGRWLVYSSDPSLDTRGGLAPQFIQYAAGAGAAPLGTGNGFLYRLAPTLAITGLTGTVSKVYDNTDAASFTGANFTATGLADGNKIASATGGSYATVNAASNISVTSPGAIGNFIITDSTGAIPVYGYALGGSQVTAKVGRITPAPLTAQIVNNPTKVYDGTTTATLNSGNYQIDGFIGSQGATVKQPSSIAYAGSDAGTVALNATFSVTNFTANAGTNLANYILPTAATGMGTINRAPLLISGLLASNKIYDGNTSDSIITGGAKLFGVIQPDSGQVQLVTSGIVGLFADANVANGIGVAVSGYGLTGDKANNYVLVAPTGLTANITPKTLTIDPTVVSANDKVYDNTKNATLSIGNTTNALNGKVGSDDVTLNVGGATAMFGQTDVGTGLDVTASGFALVGAAAGNYILAAPALTANITPKLLTIGMTGSPTKTYDGTNAVSLGSGNFNISGFVTGQSASVGQSSATYATANAGTGIDVTANLQPSDFVPGSGTSMSNYTFAPTVAGLGLGVINPLQLSGQIVGNPTKVYDGTTNAALASSNLQLVGLLSGQSISASFGGTVAGTYDNPNAGARGVSAGSLPGADFTAGSGTLLSNYLLPSSYQGSGSIIPAPLTGNFTVLDVGIVNASKIYDGTFNIGLLPSNFTLSGWIGSDNAVVAHTINGTFGQKNVGTNLALSAELATSDLTPSGSTNLANYAINAPVLGIGNITPAQLTVTITNNPTKTYNGSTDAALSSGNFLVGGWVNGESGAINPSATASYDSANASATNGRTVTATLTPGNYVLGNGTLLSNYNVDLTATGTGTINQAPLFVTGVFATNKSYDTTTTDTLNLTRAGLAGLVSTDAGNASKLALDLSGVSANFSQANVGSGLAVTATGFGITGSAAANYILQPVTGLAANITRAILTLSGVTANDKTYDNTTGATLTIAGNAALHGVFGGDTVGFDGTGASGQFATANAGTNLGVSVGGFILNGGSSSNYQLQQPAGLTATINPKQLTAVIIGSPTKVYDGTDSATLTAADYELDGFVGGQGASVPQSATANYVTKNVGTGLGVVSTLVTSDFVANAGTNLSNYILPTAGAGNRGVIQSKVIDLTGTRVYDGTATADSSLFGVLQGVNGETLGVSGSGTLVDKNVGEEKSFDNLGNLALTNGGNGGLASNYTLVGGVDWVTITPKALTADFLAFDKIYNANVIAGLKAPATLDGLVSGDDITLVNPNSAHFSDKNVGTGKTVTGDMSITGNDVGNYTFTQGTTTASISALHITVTATGKDRQYDATTADPGTKVQSTGVIGGDSVNFTFGSATFDDKNVGTNKVVTVTGVNGAGTDAGNYVVDNATVTTTANITQRVLNLSGTRIYDGTLDADANTLAPGGVLSTGLAGETLVLAGKGATADKNVGTNKGFSLGTLNIADGTNGGLSSNYTLAGGTDKLTITARPLTATFDAISKTYDGNTLAALTNAALVMANGSLTSGKITGDDVSLTNANAGTFDTKNVGNGKTVTGSMGTTGGDASNYIFTNGTALANIGKLDLTVSALGHNKVYDGTTADPGLVLSSNAVTGDDIVLGDGSVAFNDKNVGTGKTIQVGGITVSGGDAGNYNLLNTTTTATANITPFIINLHSTRVYNGRTDVSSLLFGNGVVNGTNGETLTLNGSSNVADKNVQNGKVFDGAHDMTLGNDSGLASNYAIGTSTLDITPLTITVGATADNKIYDANTSAHAHVGSGDVITGDTVDFTAGSASFLDKNVADGKEVDVAGITASGADAGNYLFNTTAKTTANITPLNIVVGATASDKVYDGNNSATATLGSGGILGTDVVTFSGDPATFSDKNVANGKTVTVAGIVSGGTDAGNYTFNHVAQTTAAITPLAITGTIVAGNKTYDGNTTAQTSGTVTGAIAGDQLGVSSTGTFTDKNAGNGKGVNVAGVLTGADAGNYTLTTNATTTADIYKVVLNLDGTRVYDGGTVASAGMFGSAGVIAGVAGESLILSGQGVLGSKNVATNLALAALGSLALNDDGAGLASNYTLVGGNHIATVTPLGIHAGITADDKVYDGNTSAVTHGVLSGVLGSDQVSLATNGAFVDKNAGNGKTVNVDGTISGGDAGNYMLIVNPTTTASISKRPVVVGAQGTDKFFDGNASDRAVLSSQGILPGDVIVFGAASALFGDSTVGVGKAVSVSGIYATGPDAGNYAFNTTAETTASINQSSSQGASAITLVQLDSVLGPDQIATPYGVASNVTVGPFSGNHKKTRQPLEKNVQRADFVPGLSLQVVDGGVRLPADAMQ
jgi:filamentous hemagglutinin family protein